jgi:hypothetical protein
MNGQGIAGDSLLGAGLADQVFGQRRALSMGDHPAHDMAAGDVQDDVQVEVSPLGGLEQFGDIPAPQLIGPGGE